ncbi:MAG: NIPSNAP family protein [bacterium]|nr:NIPSNAP family protein [bacterium]
MSVYIDVWHRTHPLTPEAHARFLDYYARYVVAPPSDYFEVVAGFRYLDGPTNEDFALYRYPSMAEIEASMRSYAVDGEALQATLETFSALEIEETRGIALHLPHAPESRLDDAIAAPGGEGAHRFVRHVRRCGGNERPAAFALLERQRDEAEKAGGGTLVVGFEYIVGPVMDLVEIWRVPADRGVCPIDDVDPALVAELARLAPERERRAIEPTRFSKLR